MTRELTARFEPVAERRQVSSGWPALVFVLLVAAAAVYSFSPRPMPPFAATSIKTDRLLVNGLAQSGHRLIVVGEQGHILIADSAKGPWREARVANARGSLLTQVAFIDSNTAIAVGHDGLILRSEDRGETWKEVAFDGEQGNALLGLAGPYDGRLFAFGGFAELRKSDDGGRTWSRISLDVPAPAKAATPAAPAKPADPNAFPFGDTGSQPAAEDRHVYAIARTSDGSLILVGEHGLLLRSHDRGEHWESLPAIYAGSLFGALALKDNGVLVFGMRGNVFRSTDGGSSWNKVAVPTPFSLFGGTVTADGEVLLVGDVATVLRSRDGGASFTRVDQPGRKALSSILPLDDGDWLTGGENGIALIDARSAGAAR